MKRFGILFILLSFSGCGRNLPEINPEIFNGSGTAIPAGKTVITFSPAAGSEPESVLLCDGFSYGFEGGEALPMQKGEDGVFRIEFDFESGKSHFFAFIVDGEMLSAYYAYGMYSPEATWMTPPENFFGFPLSDPRGCWDVEPLEAAE